MKKIINMKFMLEKNKLTMFVAIICIISLIIMIFVNGYNNYIIKTGIEGIATAELIDLNTNNNLNSETQELTNNQINGKLIIDEELVGKKVKLKINIEIATHDNEEHAIYETVPVVIDVSDCLNYLLPNYNYENLVHLYDNEKYLKSKNLIPPENYKQTILNHYTEDNNWSIQYDANNIAVMFSYIPDSKSVIAEAPGAILKREHEFIFPEPEKLHIAETLSYDLLARIFNDSFTDGFEKSFSGIKMTAPIPKDIIGPSQVYVVAYKRKIENLPVFYNKSSISFGYSTDPLYEELEVWIDNGKLIYAAGNIRRLNYKYKSRIISANEAFNVLCENFEQSNNNGEYVINTFELMYFMKSIEYEIEDSYEDNYGSAYVRYFPVWVISSSNSNNNVEADSNSYYELIIDAVTGDIVGKK